MTSNNPALRLDKSIFSPTLAPSDQMTVQGTVNKTSLLFFLVLVGAGISWGSTVPNLWIMGGSIGGLIVAFLTVVFLKTIVN